MTALAQLVSEAASTNAYIEQAIARLRARGGSMPEADGKHWRFIAACKRELDVLTGKAELLDELMQHGIAASECRRRWDELEAKRLEGSKVDVAVTG